MNCEMGHGSGEGICPRLMGGCDAMSAFSLGGIEGLKTLEDRTRRFQSTVPVAYVSSSSVLEKAAIA